MHISRPEIEKREIADREISREKWGIEKSRKKLRKINLFDGKNPKKSPFLLQFHVKKRYKSTFFDGLNFNQYKLDREMIP